MRLLLKILALVILGPIALALLMVLAVVAIVGVPILWEQFTAKYTRPPQQGATG
jgi:hypothetical protein